MYAEKRKNNKAAVNYYKDQCRLADATLCCNGVKRDSFCRISLLQLMLLLLVVMVVMVAVVVLLVMVLVVAALMVPSSRR